MRGLVRLSGDDRRWTRFAASRPEATPFHHPAWLGTITDTYGFSGFVLAMEGDEGNLEAGMPIVAKPAFFSRRAHWFSLPYTDQCVPLGGDQAVLRLLGDVEVARLSFGVAGLEVRSGLPSGTSLSHSTRGYGHVLALSDFASPEELLATLSKSRVHRGLRQARAAGVAVRASTERRDLTDIFYRLHLLTRRKQGVPIQPRRFFLNLWEKMVAPGFGCTFVAEVDGAPVAAAVFLRWNGTMVYKFGASDPARLGVRPNHALFWRAIEAGFEFGDSRLDFGRTDVGNDGLRTFKSLWGAAESTLVYSTTDSANAARGRMPDLSQRVIRASPAWVCRVLGERLYRYAS